MATKSFTALKWLYGMDNRALAGIRDLGMRLVESNPIIKRELMQRATENLTHMG
jgi:2-polyprenyl-6-methoxyphenol hydroxylase-like FAD-dependent oxidoreductase